MALAFAKTTHGRPTGSVTETNARTATVEYIVRDATDQSATVLDVEVWLNSAAGGCRLHDAADAIDLTSEAATNKCRVVNIHVEAQDDKGKAHLARVEYSTQPAAGNSGVVYEDPTDSGQTDSVSVSSVQRSVVLEKDYGSTAAGKNPKPVRTSAGGYFDPMPEAEVSDTVITVTRNVGLSLNLDNLNKYRGAVNKTEWSGLGTTLAAGVVRCMDITGDLQYRNGVPFFRLTWVFELRYGKWNPVSIEDRGCLHLEGDDPPKLVPNMSSDGKTVLPEPVALNGEGQMAEAGAPPVYIDFYFYREEEFDGTAPDGVFGVGDS